MSLPDRLFSENRKLAAWEAGKLREFTRCAADRADLSQEAELALWEAATRWRPSHGTPFVGFACPWIRGRLLNWLRSQKRQTFVCGGSLHTVPVVDPDPPEGPENPYAELSPEGDPRLDLVRHWRHLGRTATWIARKLGVPPAVVREWIGGERIAGAPSGRRKDPLDG